MKFGLRYASLGRYSNGPAAVELAQVPVSSAAGLPAQVKTPDDVIRYGKEVIARFR